MESVESIISISKKIEKKINLLIREIFDLYRDQFLMEEKDFIVPAVWGAVKDGSLNEFQISIFSKIGPEVDRIISVMDVDQLGVPQRFAIRYLINQMIITSLIYMTEIAKNDLESSVLNNMKPIGHA